MSRKVFVGLTLSVKHLNRFSSILDIKPIAILLEILVMVAN